MSRIIEKVRQDQARQDVPAFRAGDTVRVHVRLKEAEGEKERVQPFEGVVISRRGQSSGATFTVRRVSFGIGVERIFPVNSPMISSIEVLAGRAAFVARSFITCARSRARRLAFAAPNGPRRSRRAGREQDLNRVG